MVLVGSDGREPGLGEDECLKVLIRVGGLAPRRDVDDVQAGLVPVHRVQDHLRPRVIIFGTIVIQLLRRRSAHQFTMF